MTALSFQAVSTVDYHTGGEPFRIVAAPPVELPGATVAERRVRAIRDPRADGLRKLLCLEPRGHADMYGGFITSPDDAGADFGVLFWHKDGFSTACGHGTIALGAWAVETIRVPAAVDGATEVRIDVPSGRVVARVHTEAGRVSAVDFVNVPSYLLALDVEVATSRGTVRVDIGFGGAIYAQLRADRVGLAVVPEQVNELIAIGREIKWLLHESAHAKHPSDDRLGGIYGTIVFEERGRPRTARSTSATSPSSPTARSTGRPAARARRPGSRSSQRVGSLGRVRRWCTTRSSAPPSGAGSSTR